MRTGRGRWYEAVGGLGLEVEHYDSASEHTWWHVAGQIRENGKRRPQFTITKNPYQDNHPVFSGTFSTMDEAKREFIRQEILTEVLLSE